MVQKEHSHKRDDRKPHNEEKEIVDEEELKNAKKSEFKVEDGPGKGDENMGITHDGKMKPNPNPKYENKQLEEEQLDEDEVEESARGYTKANKSQHDSQGGNRVADRLRESIYDRFRKLIK